MRTFVLRGFAVLTPLALALVPAVAASAAGVPSTVSITVVLDLDSSPRVFEVTDVPVGPGPELTEANETSNPSDWCGALTVDVDNVAETITVTGVDGCYFETASVIVEGAGIESVTTLSNGAVGPDSDCSLSSSATVPKTGSVQLEWSAPCNIVINDGGVSSYSYTSETATTSSTSSGTVVPTTVTVPPVGIQPTVVTPNFTG